MKTPRAFFGRLQNLSANRARTIGTGIALLLLIFLLWHWPTPLLLGYLAGWTFWLGLPIGTMGITLIHRLTGGDWGNDLLDHDSPRATTIGLMAFLILPVLIGIAWLYPWATHQVTEATADTRFRDWYLSPAFFVVRTIVYFLIWTVMARVGRRTVGGAGFCLLLLFITGSLAEFDWLGTLTPDFYSTIFGLYVLMAFGLTALCVLILIALATHPDPPPERMTDWGNLLLTFVIMHAYLAFSQFLIIWSGNLPREISWYVPRTRGAWGATAALLIVIQLFLPLLVLLMRNGKRNRYSLAATASGIIAAQWIEAAWLVLPAVQEHGLPPWQTLLALMVMLVTTAGIALVALPRVSWLKTSPETAEVTS